MRQIFIICLLVVLIFSCNTTNQTLKRYYKKNAVLHQALADSLHNYSVRYKTRVTMQKKIDDNSGKVYFMHYSQKDNLHVLIEFDSLLIRHDQRPEYTSQITVPIEIIKLFKKMPYNSLIADSSEVFFAYKWNLDGNTIRGIVIDRDSVDNSKRHIKRLAKNVYVTNGIVP